MKFRLAPWRYVCALALVLLGIAGILMSPAAGLSAGTEPKVFTMKAVREYPWGTALATSELELPFIENERGLLFMHCFLAGGLLSLFGGVHWFALLRRQR